MADLFWLCTADKYRADPLIDNLHRTAEHHHEHLV
jgi:hypothetical protein